MKLFEEIELQKELDILWTLEDAAEMLEDVLFNLQQIKIKAKDDDRAITLVKDCDSLHTKVLEWIEEETT